MLVCEIYAKELGLQYNVLQEWLKESEDDMNTVHPASFLGLHALALAV